MTTAPAAPARYPTVVRPVDDVALIGSADLGPWREALERAGVYAFRVEADRVEIQLFAASTRFKGVRFRELSLSISVSRDPAGGSRDGVYLATAVDSVRFFAWVERTFFKTPYEHGRVALEVGLEGGAGPRISASTKGGARLEAAAACDDRERGPGDDRWEGPIHLPPRPGKADVRCFFGRIEGASTAFAFDPRVDRCDIEPGDNGALSDLAASGFEPLRWQVRTGAVHARTPSRVVAHRGGA